MLVCLTDFNNLNIENEQTIKHITLLYFTFPCLIIMTLTLNEGFVEPAGKGFYVIYDYWFLVQLVLS